VARVANAPSGSMYHRFPTRAALCGELWMRTEERFHAGLGAALATSGEPQTRCIAAARFTVQWCRDRPVEAQVLLTGADALGAAIVGGPDTVRRGLEDFISRTGADELMVTANIFDHAKRKRSFEIVAELHGGMKSPALAHS